MTLPLRFSRALGGTLLLVCAAGLAPGCATRAPQDPVVWLTSTNACHASFQHVWADHHFHSATSSVQVDILLPRSDWLALAQGGTTSTRDDHAASQSGADRASTHSDADQFTNSVLSQQSALRPLQHTATARRGESESKAVSKQDAATAGTATHRAEQGNQSKAARLQVIDHAGQQRDGASAARSISQDKQSSAVHAEFKSQLVSEDKRSRIAAATRAGSSREGAHDAHTLVEAVFPVVVVRKTVAAAQVLAGDRVMFTIRVQNQGDLVVHALGITDTDPQGMTFTGIDYTFLEQVLPFLRDVRSDGPGRFRIKGSLAPGDTRAFTTSYRADRPAPVVRPQDGVEKNDK
jgi:uncharacterized repeat protein (TIGR01451 family)